MSGSKALKILQEIASRYGGKVWVARRIGRRLSYVDGLKAGRELFVPHEILADDGEFVVFGEGIVKDEWLEGKIEELLGALRG